MKTALIILAAIILVALLAYFVVNKVPNKFRPLVSLALWALTIFLGYLIYTSIMGPINFNNAKEKRYTPVVDNLKMIRDAQNAYKDVTGNFTPDKNKLIAFVDTAKYALTQVKNVVVIEKRGALDIEVDKRVVDTIGFKDVRADFAGRDYKNMFKVPGTSVEFDLETSFVEKVQGLKAPVFEAKVKKDVVLEGLNKDFIRQEMEAYGGSNVSGEYISVGSLDDVKTSGNWPPSYDTAEERDKGK